MNDAKYIGLDVHQATITEEGTWAAWLHDLLLPHVTRLLVCDSRKNALLQAGNKNDRIDARKLSDLLYMNKLSAVYHRQGRNCSQKPVSRPGCFWQASRH